MIERTTKTARVPLRAPTLIGLPDGLSVSGITLWALRLAGVLAAQGHPVCLALHAEPEGQVRLPMELPAGVAVLPLHDLPPVRSAAGDLTPYIRPYRDAIRHMWRRTGTPVVYIPSTVGDSFGIGAALTLTEPEMVRVIGWQHADSTYDTRLMTYYEPALVRLVGVSGHIAQTIRAALPERAADTIYLPNAVPVGHAPPERGSLTARPIRLLYSGRVEHKQKRVSALIETSDELARRHVPHSLTLLGDGPALEEMRAAAATPERRSRVFLPGAVGHSELRAALREGDCCLLTSRYEGLSVAMLEAMTEGCTPIVTSVASGAGDVVVDGESGLLVPVAPDASDRAVAVAMADAVQRFIGADPRRFALEAWRRVRDSFSLERYAPAAAALVDDAANAAPASWPGDRSPAFTSTAGERAGFSGSVPRDGAARLGAVLRRLAGRRVILHGAGRHTIELASVLAASPATIIGVTDDDPASWGRTLLGWTISSPARARELGASDVVISSWLHADEIFSRRSVYAAQGVRVHHLYREAGEAAPEPYTSAA